MIIWVGCTVTKENLDQERSKIELRRISASVTLDEKEVKDDEKDRNAMKIEFLNEIRVLNVKFDQVSWSWCSVKKNQSQQI